MGKKLFVGNLNWKSTSDDVSKLFEGIGAVEEAKVIIDKVTQQSRGFAFVTMGSDADAQTAIAELNNKEFMGRSLKVNEAMDKRRDDRN